MEKTGEELLLLASRLVYVRYVKVSSVALLLAESIQLLPLEIQYVWKTDWSIPTVLYILTRYTAYIDVILSLLHWTVPKLSVKACTNVYKALACSTYVGIALAEFVLILRTYAIYRRSKKVLYWLVSLWTFILLGSAVILYFFTESVRVTPPPLPIIPACNIIKASPIIFVCFAAFLLFEILIVIMTVREGYYTFRNTYMSHSPLLVVLYRDGVAYFIVLTLVNLSNVVVLVATPEEFSGILITFTRVVHTIFCCRILLNLRIAHNDDDPRELATYVEQPPPTGHGHFIKTRGRRRSSLAEADEVPLGKLRFR